MIYGLVGIGIGILIASLWEMMYFNKNIKDDPKLGEYNTSKRKEKIFKKEEDDQL